MLLLKLHQTHHITKSKIKVTTLYTNIVYKYNGRSSKTNVAICVCLIILKNLNIQVR